MNFNNFTIKSQEAVQEAVNLVQSRGQQAIEPVHIMQGVLQVGENVTNFIFQKLGMIGQQVALVVDKQIDSLPKVSGGEPYLSRESNEVLQKATQYSKEMGDEFVSLEHIILALLTVKSTVSTILKDAGMTEKELRNAISELRKGEKVTSQSSEDTYQSLEKYAINLNETYKRCKQWTDKTLEDIENLLTFSVDAYGLKACIQPTDIRELLTQITTEYRQNNSIGKQIDIQTEISPTVPLAQVDPLLLYSALGNLLGNAIKYSGTKVRIRIGCRREAKKWILTVQDDGYGIPPEEQKFIFQEYKRGQRYKGDKQRKGFGLGLCYVAAVVKAHHGHIQVNSDGKQGTEFIIEIPQRKAKRRKARS